MGIFDLFKNKNNSEEGITEYVEEKLEKNSQNIEAKEVEGATFLMRIQEFFWINGKGLVATGVIDKGNISVGDTVNLLNSVNREKLETRVAGIEMFMKRVKTASAGERVGIVLEGITKTDVDKGDILYK